jgi:hypothetical protein
MRIRLELPRPSCRVLLEAWDRWFFRRQVRVHCGTGSCKIAWTQVGQFQINIVIDVLLAYFSNYCIAR